MRTTVIIIIIAFAGFGVLTTNAAILTTVTAFEDFVNVLSRISNITEKLRFIQAVWGEVRADYSDDFKKATLLYQQFEDLTSSKNPKEAQAVRELQQELRRYLKSRLAAQLAKAWNGNEFPNVNELLSFCDYLQESYEADLVHEIYAQAIDEIYPHRPADVLAAFFAQIYVHNNSRTFELMLYTQLHLYWKFINEKDINDKYLLNMGNYYYQAQNDALYEGIDKELKRRLSKAIESLPKSVQIFFFEKSFCLKNKGRNQYLLNREETDIDTDRRYVQAIHPDNIPPTNFTTTVWTREFVKKSGNENGVPSQLFWLKNKEMYMYLDQDIPGQLDLVASWRSSKNMPATRNWHLQMIENYLVFSHNGFVMCVSRQPFDDVGLLIYGYQDIRFNAGYPDCQWIIEKC